MFRHPPTKGLPSCLTGSAQHLPTLKLGSRQALSLIFGCGIISSHSLGSVLSPPYRGHFSGQLTTWPKEGIKRGNAIRLNSETRKWLYPNGFYTVVRRFSSKEESRRIVASVVRPDSFPGAPMLGFENHLNVFHQGRHGLPEALAYGLAAYSIHRRLTKASGASAGTPRLTQQICA